MSDAFSQQIDQASSPQLAPHSREAEEAVVGSVLINPEAYYDVADFLTAEDFHIHRLRWIWEAFTSLHEQRIPMDMLTVTEELDRVGHLAEVGGPAYLTSLVNNVPTSLHAEAYGRLVQQGSIRRRSFSPSGAFSQTARRSTEEPRRARDPSSRNTGLSRLPMPDKPARQESRQPSRKPGFSALRRSRAGESQRH